MHKVITGHTILTGLLGSPVSHSISPLMHNESFSHLGLDYIYLAFDVPTIHLKTAVEGLKALNIRGFNLTMPHKTLMCDLVDHLTPAAKLAQSVNTVINDNGILTGHTTDGIGFMKAAIDAGYSLLNQKITILGAGGASTAICVQAALDGVTEIDLFQRRGSSFQNTETFVSKLNKETTCNINLYDLADVLQLKSSLSTSYMLVNTTPVGMTPNNHACIIKDASILPKHLIVSDIIYNPRQTQLLKMAQSQGCPIFNGLYMLLYQGAAAFEHWTNCPMPVAHIKEKFFTD